MHTRIASLYEDREEIAALTDYDSLYDWWMSNSLEKLLDGKGADEKDELKGLAWNSIRWSAMKIDALDRAFAQVINENKGSVTAVSPDPQLLDKMSVVVVGSVGRMETSLIGDIDLNFVLRIPPPKDWECMDVTEIYLVRRLNRVMWELAPRMSEEKFLTYSLRDRRLFSITTTDVGQSPEPTSTFFLNLLVGRWCIWNPRPIEGSLEQFRKKTSDRRLRQSTIDLMYRISSDSIEKGGLGTTGTPPIEKMGYFYKVLSKSLIMICIAAGLAVSRWQVTYFRLADELKERNLLMGDEWKAIRLAVIEMIRQRGRIVETPTSRVSYNVILQSVLAAHEKSRLFVIGHGYTLPTKSRL